MGGAQSRAVLADTGLAVECLTLVGGVLEHVPDRCGIPSRLAAPPRDPLPIQALTDLDQRAAFHPVPLEDPYDCPGLGRDDLEPRHAVALSLADVAISIWGLAEDADRAIAGRVQLPAAAPLQDLGPLVLGDHPLHLEQQSLLRVLAD